MATVGQAGFTVLVEIKKPQSPLLKGSYGRNAVFLLGDELVGGVSQLQVNCETWNLEGSRSRASKHLEKGDIYTCQPKGILVIGNLKQLDTEEKLYNFELFRRNLHNPEVITFDELYERAKFIVSHLVETRACHQHSDAACAKNSLI